LIKHLGGHVIAITSSEEKAQLVRSYGADHVIVSKAPSEADVQRVLQITGGKGVDVVYDSNGQATFEEDREMIKIRGLLVTYGNATVSSLGECVLHVKKCSS
jgi:NADPH2:quinone reductase